MTGTILTARPAATSPNQVGQPRARYPIRGRSNVGHAPNCGSPAPDVGARRSEPLAAYAALHDHVAGFETGDPEATKPAILAIVDAPNPPRRVFLGRSFEPVAREYRQRLAEWERWQDLALAAFGREAG